MTNLETHPPATLPAAAPEAFPIIWQHPDDARLFWTQDREHYAKPSPLLSYELLVHTLEPGFRAATQAYDLPFAGPRYWRLNTYLYSTMVPAAATPAEMETKGQQAEARLTAAMAQLGDLWAHTWLPEIKAHRAWLDGADLSSASPAALVEYLDEGLRRSARLWDLHFRVLFPAGLAVSVFEDYYRDLFPGATALEAYGLLAGFDNKSLERDRELWRLSRLALAAQLPAEALGEPQATPAGQQFEAALKAFLAEFGYNGDPPWIKAPGPVLQIIAQYMALPERDFAAELAALAAEREQRVAEARARLKDYPAPVREQFEFLLKAAQVGTVLMEDHAHWLDHRALTQVLWALGRRLAEAGVLAQADDLELLMLDEVRETALALPRLDRRTLVEQRRAELAHFAAISPPPVLGTPPAGAPPANPLTTAMGKFFGLPPQPSASAGEVRGHAGSGGRARGTARVIRSLAEAHRLQAGDILVAEATSPAWTPLFATAAAVVTDLGGVLSHSASVAREYRLPAVVGTGAATRQIPDGALVEVDGDEGVVRLVA